MDCYKSWRCLKGVNWPDPVLETGIRCIPDVKIVTTISNLCISMVQMVRLRNMPKVSFGVIG